MTKRKTQSKTKRKPTEKITRAILAADGRVMKVHADGRQTLLRDKTNWAALAKMRDEDINYSDSPKFTDKEWAKAKLIIPEPKDRVTIRLDPDVLKWLKHQGAGYQTRINAILRQYMAAHSNR